MRIREVQNLLTNKGFNPYIDISNSDRVLIHLLEESGEIARGHRKFMNCEDTRPDINCQPHFKQLQGEIGDLFILLCFYASSVGVDLQNAVFGKITDNILKGKFGKGKQTLKELEGLL